MRIRGIKLWIDTGIHPDNVTNQHMTQIKKLPQFDEWDAWDETFQVAFWLDHLDQIPTAQQNLHEVFL